MTTEKKESVAVSAPKGEMAEYKEQRASVEGMLMQAIKEKTDPAVVEKFLAMRKELKAEWAKEQFDRAMAAFQIECPEVKKLKKAMDGNKVLYAYADLGSMAQQVKPFIGKNGLSYFIKTETREDPKEGKMVKSICVVKHVSGHSEESVFEVPLGTKTGIMSNSQVAAAAATFSKRYAFMNAFGIMTADEDKEEGLKDATPGQVEAATMLLDKCMTVADLKKVWSNFSKEIKANKEIIRKANEIKSNIENETAQGN